MSESQERFSRPPGQPLVPPFWPTGSKTRLMAAMVEVACQRGYAEVTVEDVLARAESSRRTFYGHFANKEEAFLAAYDAILEDAIALTTDEDDAASGWESRLAALLERVLTHYAAFPHHAHILLTEVLSVGPRGADRYERTMRNLAGLFADCPSWDVEGEGLSRDDMAQALVGAIHRMVQVRVFSGRAASLPGLAPALTELAIGASSPG